MADFDAYKILQVDHEADPEVIQAAYRRLARKYHPDVAAGPDAEHQMATINRAWEILRNADRRAEHDRARAAGSGPGDAAAPTAGATTPGVPTDEADARSRPTSPPGQPPSPGRSSLGARPTGTAGATSRPPDAVSRDWTTGRSTIGGGYDPATMGQPDAYGAAGEPRGPASGSLINFGRYSGWSLGQIARIDIEYIEWLDRMPIGRSYRTEIDLILRAAGRRTSESTDATNQRGLFRRR